MYEFIDRLTVDMYKVNNKKKGTWTILPIYFVSGVCIGNIKPNFLTFNIQFNWMFIKKLILYNEILKKSY